MPPPVNYHHHQVAQVHQKGSYEEHFQQSIVTSSAVFEELEEYQSKGQYTLSVESKSNSLLEVVSHVVIRLRHLFVVKLFRIEWHRDN